MNVTNTVADQKYGDGFVTSVGNPAVSAKYGNTHYGQPASTMGQGPAAPVEPAKPKEPEVVPPEQMCILQALTGTISQLQALGLSKQEQKMLVEASNGVVALEKKLATKAVSEATLKQLFDLANCFNTMNIKGAQSIQVALTSSDWSAHKDWLKGLKYLIQVALKKAPAH